MGKYSDIAERFDGMARKAFSDYHKAERQLQEAKKACSENPEQFGFGADPKKQEKAIRAKLKLSEAEAEFKEAKRTFENQMNLVADLRSELLERLTDDLQANPKDFDRETADFLEMGLCSPVEIQNIFDKAKTATMKRWIGRYAEKRSAEVEKLALDDGQKAEARRTLNEIAEKGRLSGKIEEAEEWKAFQVMEDCFSRCTHNPAMTKYWGELTENAMRII